MHDKGVLLHAHGTHPINYVQQAIFCVEQIQEHLQLPVALVTSETTGVKKYPEGRHFSHVIRVKPSNTKQKRKFLDGETYKQVTWDNHSRIDSYDLTPFKETIVMDTDLIVGNSNLLKCFDSNKDFLINNESIYVNAKHRKDLRIQYMNNFIKMYWATCFYFKKTKWTKEFFELLKHIKLNYEFYRFAYNIVETKYRNDYAFTIAMHIMNNFTARPNDRSLPIKLFYVTDQDKVISYKDFEWKFALPKDDGTFFRCDVKQSNMHVMNKFALDRIINELK